ncbi:hypothetical protein SAICODRAFT_32087 [Saitoella complicata NRRL Y-17804]|nr:uncharacterized protein SAICODRAFT_32087 [Saitoella complicata NRRL Y-17804]ODQ50111.1 hypothetical protein SAICODRAFT_32087 [Saitoella complicata NRRL Y-17804]
MASAGAGGPTSQSPMLQQPQPQVATNRRPSSSEQRQQQGSSQNSSVPPLSHGTAPLVQQFRQQEHQQQQRQQVNGSQQQLPQNGQQHLPQMQPPFQYQSSPYGMMNSNSGSGMPPRPTLPVPHPASFTQFHGGNSSSAGAQSSPVPTLHLPNSKSDRLDTPVLQQQATAPRRTEQSSAQQQNRMQQPESHATIQQIQTPRSQPPGRDTPTDNHKRVPCLCTKCRGKLVHPATERRHRQATADMSKLLASRVRCFCGECRKMSLGGVLVERFVEVQHRAAEQLAEQRGQVSEQD